MSKQPTATTIDEYIQSYPEDIQKKMTELRNVIHQASPDAGEKISWGMATFTYYGNLVHFAGAKNHLGFYPAPEAIEAFRDELAPYHCSKGAVQLPYDQPLPLDLIRRMVEYRTRSQRQAFLEKEEKK